MYNKFMFYQLKKLYLLELRLDVLNRLKSDTGYLPDRLNLAYLKTYTELNTLLDRLTSMIGCRMAIWLEDHDSTNDAVSDVGIYCFMRDTGMLGESEEWHDGNINEHPQYDSHRVELRQLWQSNWGLKIRDIINPRAKLLIQNEDPYGSYLWGEVNEMLNRLNGLEEKPLSEKLRVFNHALNTLHFNGTMADYLLSTEEQGNGAELLKELSDIGMDVYKQIEAEYKYAA